MAASFGGDKGLQEEYEDEEAGAKKKPRKSGPQSGQYYRRNIKDVLSEEKLQNVTKEAKVRNNKQQDFFPNLARVLLVFCF